MKRPLKSILLWATLAIVSCLGGCSKSMETTTALDDSKMPWGRPASWEKTMPIAPGFQY
ncbi:MAG: hypothetical protein LBE99_00755 [Puniceicoccales bacterium]|jgi:hypothetical protein|nr:hypothetical protein [Puniceicoccales bacterium]